MKHLRTLFFIVFVSLFFQINLVFATGNCEQLFYKRTPQQLFARYSQELFKKIQASKLKQAIVINDPQTVRKLINKGIDINAKDEKETPFLFTAISNNRMRISQILISNKDVNVNVTGKNGTSALQLSIIFRDKYVFHLLLGKDNIDVNKQDWQGNTPLHEAIYSDQIGIAEDLMLHKDINITLKNKDGKDAFFYVQNKTFIYNRLKEFFPK